MRFSRRELTIAVGLILAFAVPLTRDPVADRIRSGDLKTAGEARFARDASAGAADQHR